MAKRTTNKPSPVYAERLTRCRKQMKKHGISAYLVFAPHDYYYLTGFTGEDAAIVVTSRDVHVITDGRFDQTFDMEIPWAKKWMRKGLTLHPEIAEVAKSAKVKKIGVNLSDLTVDDHAGLKKAVRPLKVEPAPAIAANLRAIKDKADLAAIRKSIKVAEESFDAMRQTIRLGQTELDMAAMLEYEMRRRGSTRPAFATICAEGPNAALPHATPGKRKVKKGSAVLFDWGAEVGGYCSDLTRMVFIGSMSKKMAQVYDVVLEAQLRAIAALRPGARMCDVDAVARDYIASHGYGDQFTHGLGHGMGLLVHEAPSLSYRSKATLEAGMLVTVEPGIYLPGVGGVRIEDDVLITPTGSRVLTHLGKSARDAVLTKVR